MHFHFKNDGCEGKALPVFWNDGIYFDSSATANKLLLFAHFETRGCAFTNWQNEISFIIWYLYSGATDLSFRCEPVKSSNERSAHTHNRVALAFFVHPAPKTITWPAST